MVIINYLAKWMLRKVLMRTSIGYRFLLRKEHGITGPNGYPNAPWANAVLRSQEEVDSAVEQVRKLGLPLMSDLSKNWDSLAALNIILRILARMPRFLMQARNSILLYCHGCFCMVIRT